VEGCAALIQPSPSSPLLPLPAQFFSSLSFVSLFIFVRALLVVRARARTARVVPRHLVLIGGSFRGGCILVLGFGLPHVGVCAASPCGPPVLAPLGVTKRAPHGTVCARLLRGHKPRTCPRMKLMFFSRPSTRRLSNSLAGRGAHLLSALRQAHNHRTPNRNDNRVKTAKPKQMLTPEQTKGREKQRNTTPKELRMKSKREKGNSRCSLPSLFTRCKLTQPPHPTDKKWWTGGQRQMSATPATPTPAPPQAGPSTCWRPTTSAWQPRTPPPPRAPPGGSCPPTEAAETLLSAS